MWVRKFPPPSQYHGSEKYTETIKKLLHVTAYQSYDEAPSTSVQNVIALCRYAVTHLCGPFTILALAFKSFFGRSQWPLTSRLKWPPVSNRGSQHCTASLYTNGIFLLAFGLLEKIRSTGNFNAYWCSFGTLFEDIPLRPPQEAKMCICMCICIQAQDRSSSCLIEPSERRTDLPNTPLQWHCSNMMRFSTGALLFFFAVAVSQKNCNTSGTKLFSRINWIWKYFKHLECRLASLELLWRAANKTITWACCLWVISVCISDKLDN